MIANMIASVPKILLEERMEGAIASMLLSIVAGLLLIYLFIRFFHAFPGKDFPELLKEYLPRWMYFPYLLLLVFFWYTAGLITLVTYSFMLKRFLTPDMSLVWIVSSFLIFISFGILMNSKHVLFTVENVLVFSLPVIVFLIIKAYSSQEFKWDFVREAIMYMNRLPSYSAFSASFYTFMGIINIIVFNRVFSIKMKRVTWKQLSALGIAGSAILFTTYFVPIGLNGFEKINELVYPAVTTSDSLRMKYGIIERVLYLFLPFFLAITFLSLLIHWHVAIEVSKNAIWFKRFQWKKNNLTPYLFVAIFWLAAIQMVTYLTEYQLMIYTSYFFNMQPFFGLLFIITFWYIIRRARA